MGRLQRNMNIFGFLVTGGQYYDKLSKNEIYEILILIMNIIRLSKGQCSHTKAFINTPGPLLMERDAV